MPGKVFPLLSPVVYDLSIFTCHMLSLQLTEIWEQRYEQRGIDSSYLFRVDDEWVVSP